VRKVVFVALGLSRLTWVSGCSLNFSFNIDVIINAIRIFTGCAHRFLSSDLCAALVIFRLIGAIVDLAVVAA
jgi:hypothetical protein